jgi:hypothetical protein
VFAISVIKVAIIFLSNLINRLILNIFGLLLAEIELNLVQVEVD